jgi:hypothetical protein
MRRETTRSVWKASWVGLVLMSSGFATTACAGPPADGDGAEPIGCECVELTYTSITMETPRAIPPEELAERWQRVKPDLFIRACSPWAVKRVEAVLARDQWRDIAFARSPDVRARIDLISSAGERRQVYLAVTGVAVEGGRTRVHVEGAGVHALLWESMAGLMIP